MIFVTTGTQEPFDRLIKVIDEIADEFKELNFVVQAFQSDYKAKNFEVFTFVKPAVFDAYVDEAELIISHAGMGTIISSMVKNKPLLVMPRLIKYREHRNEHQLATAKKLDSLGYVNVAYDGQELKSKFLKDWPGNLKSFHSLNKVASNDLIKSLDTFIKY